MPEDFAGYGKKKVRVKHGDLIKPVSSPRLGKNIKPKKRRKVAIF